jgi:hypothetical protein
MPVAQSQPANLANFPAAEKSHLDHKPAAFLPTKRWIAEHRAPTIWKL